MRLQLERAAAVLRGGGLVVYPTDTLWGLGAVVSDEGAVGRVFEAKGRPREQPLSIAVADPADVDRYGVVTPLARRLFSLLPGALTLVLERRPSVPSAVTGGASTVGIRVPDHPVALDLLRFAGPLTCTSANRHALPEARTLEEARAQLGDRVDYYLNAASPPSGRASTLVDARGGAPKILRPGAILESRIRECLAD